MPPWNAGKQAKKSLFSTTPGRILGTGSLLTAPVKSKKHTETECKPTAVEDVSNDGRDQDEDGTYLPPEGEDSSDDYEAKEVNDDDETLDMTPAQEKEEDERIFRAAAADKRFTTNQKWGLYRAGFIVRKYERGVPEGEVCDVSDASVHQKQLVGENSTDTVRCLMGEFDDAGNKYTGRELIQEEHKRLGYHPECDCKVCQRRMEFDVSTKARMDKKRREREAEELHAEQQEDTAKSRPVRKQPKELRSGKKADEGYILGED